MRGGWRRHRRGRCRCLAFRSHGLAPRQRVEEPRCREFQRDEGRKDTILAFASWYRVYGFVSTNVRVPDLRYDEEDRCGYEKWYSLKEDAEKE